MKLTVIGCGDAFSSEGRRNTSFLLQSKSKNILMDFGATSLYGLKSLAIDPSDIDMVIISHFHGDHFGGIPFLIINRQYNEVAIKRLVIAGPKGVKSRIYDLQKNMYPGTEELINDDKLDFVEFDSDNHQEIDEMNLWTTEVIHSPPSNPHGYKLTIEGKTIAYSGDTEWTEKLNKLANETDLFICECNDLHNEVPGHLSYDLLQPHLEKFNSKRVVLTHMGTEMILAKPEAELLNDGIIIEF
ncbi:MAG: MBL fold metallo-hydrolase [Cyclobacteriaceae bacterium]